MKVIEYSRHGGPEVLDLVDRPAPNPKPGEVLVRMKAVSLNHLDIHVRRGIPGLKIELPHVPGCDGAGVIEALGEGVTDSKTGDRVVIDPSLSCESCDRCREGDISSCHRYRIFGEHLDGTCAEWVTLPARNAVPMPTDFDFVTAGAAPLVYLTAWHMLVTKAQVKEGDRLLIMGAGSGVTMAAIQIAKMLGATVFTTTASTEKAERAKQELGADEVIDYTAQPIDKEVRRLTDKKGVDVVIDHVGGEHWVRLLRSLRNGGTLVTCGATAGFDPREDLRQIFFRQLRILGSTMGNHDEFHAVMKLVFDGKLKPIVDAVFPLDKAADAHRRMEDRKSFGKIVLTP